MTRQCFDEFHRLFGIRYPFGEYHQAFVPEFNAGAMENPGCVTFRDPLVFSAGSPAACGSRGPPRSRTRWPTSGSATSPRRRGGTTSGSTSRFAEYMGNRVTADVTEYADAWTNNAYARRQWGLVADQRPSTHPVAGNGAVDAAAALQDFDGISYAKGSSDPQAAQRPARRRGLLRRGRSTTSRSHRFGNATMHDLFGSWERAGGRRPLGRSPATGCARPASTGSSSTATAGRGPAYAARADHPADRSHTLPGRSAATTDGSWATTGAGVGAEPAPYAVPEGAAVLLDPFEDTWAVPHVDADDGRPRSPTLLPGDRGPGAARRHLERPAQRLPRRGARPRRRYLDLVGRQRCRSRTSDDALVYRPRAGSHARAACSRPRSGARADPRRAVGKPGRHRGPARSALQLAAFRTPSPRAPTADRLRRWLAAEHLPDRLELDLDLRWRVLVRLAALGAIDRDELRRHAGRRAHRRSHGRAHRARSRRCPTPRPRRSPGTHFTGEPRRPQLRARGGRPRDVARRPGGAHRAVRRRATSPSCPRRPRSASGWVLGRRDGVLLPAHLAERGHPRSGPGAARRRRASTSSVRRRLVDAADELARRLAVREAYAASMSARRRPPTRPDRAHARDRAAQPTASAPARTGSPPRSRWRSGSPGPARPARRVWVTMRTPGHDFELAAGWPSTRAWSARDLLHGVAYCTDADLDPGAGVQRRHRHPRRAAAARPRAPARRLGRRVVGVRRLRQGQHRRGARAAAAPTTWAGALPAADVVRRLPDRLRDAPAGLRPHRRRARRRALSTADGEPARRPRGRRPPQRRRQGDRRAGAGRRRTGRGAAWW